MHVTILLIKLEGQQCLDQIIAFVKHGSALLNIRVSSNQMSKLNDVLDLLTLNKYENSE